MLKRLILVITLVLCAAHSAQAENRYASIIVDADNLDVLHAREIDKPRYPASLTKVMTLYLTFEAIDEGRLQLNQRLIVSKTAAQTPPVKMGLRTGQAVPVDTLIQAIAVRSSNDAAVVIAEHLGGSEASFAQLMTTKARALGMQRTIFKTANGLPHPDQKTTARDMAKLASAMLRQFPHYYHYMGQKEFRGQKNTNRLLRTRNDVDGFKTGFTRASGYNLMVSATQNGRRLIAIVLGGASNDSRNQHMSDLIDRGFDVIAKQAPTVQIAETQKPSGSTPVFVELRGHDSQPVQVQTAGTKMPISHSKATDWTVQIKNFSNAQHATHIAERILDLTQRGVIETRSGFSGGKAIYHARVTGLSAKLAQSVCADTDLSLEVGGRRCLIIAP